MELFRLSLHSTMSSINHNILKICCFNLFLYIPLCHLLISFIVNKMLHMCNLYIPLCHLLILSHSWLFRLPMPLHSTMSSMGNAQFNIPGLYIPLCHLLILCFPMHTRHFSFFTFHYVIY